MPSLPCFPTCALLAEVVLALDFPQQLERAHQIVNVFNVLYVKGVVAQEEENQTDTSASPTGQMRHPQPWISRGQPLPLQAKTGSSLKQARNKGTTKVPSFFHNISSW